MKKKGRTKTSRSEMLQARVSPETLATAKTLAERTGRTLSSLTDYVLREYIRKEGGKHDQRHA